MDTGNSADFPPKYHMAKETVGERRYTGITEAFEPTNTATNKRFLLTIIHSINRAAFCGQKEAISANLLMLPGLTLC